MSFLFFEGFEHVRTATDLSRRFPENNASVPATLPTQVGRVKGGRCLRIENTTCTFRTAALAPGDISIKLGFGVRVHNCANAWPQITITNAANAEQLSIHTICPGTHVQYRLMRGAVQLAISDNLPMDTYHYVELDATIDAAFGSFAFRVDEFTVGQSVGFANTANAGGAGFSKLAFNLSTVAGAGNFIEIDDLYVRDGSQGNLLGAVVIEGLAPIGVGASQTASQEYDNPAFTDNFLEVDDALTGGADDDTTYVESPLAIPDTGVIDLYQMQDLVSAKSSVLATRMSLDVRNSGASNESLVPDSYKDKILDNYGDLAVTPSGANYKRVLVDTDIPKSPEYIDAAEWGYSPDIRTAHGFGLG